MNSLLPPEKPIVIGKILTTHGVQGQMKVQSMMHHPEMLERMTPFWIIDKPFAQWSLFKPTGRHDIFLARLPEISTMDHALDLRHGHIVVDRSQLPLIEGEIYYTDLENKPVVDCNGLSLGIVKHVHDFGAGPVLELDSSGTMVSFHAIIDADSDIIQLNIASAALF
jgi:16S rRNA processing protein RimM